MQFEDNIYSKFDASPIINRSSEIDSAPYACVRMHSFSVCMFVQYLLVGVTLSRSHARNWLLPHP